MDDSNLIPISTHSASGWTELLIFLGIILLVALALFFWAFAIRTRKNRIRKHRRHHRHKQGFRDQLKKAVEEIREHKHRRHERHPLNPTLAESGGLPPRRDPDQPPPTPLP